MAAALAASVLATSGPALAQDGPAAVNVLDPPAELPAFLERPTPGAFATAYPRGAAAEGMSGRGVLHCQVANDGRLDRCQVVREFPTGAGFGPAALALAHAFRIDPGSEAARRGDLELPIGFAAQGSEDEQLVTGPWLAAPSFADVAAAYPDIGGGVAGQVFLRCGLERDGSVHGCKAKFMRPADREFDVAALKISHQFKMLVNPALMRRGQSMVANVLLSLAAPYSDDAKARRITDPLWLAAPDPPTLARLYPAAAKAKGVASGVGLADCTVAADGSLQGCRPFGSGDPPGLGFSDAAAQAAAPMRMSPWTNAGGPVDGALVRVPIRFTQAAR
jgi:TonB family protein